MSKASFIKNLNKEEKIEILDYILSHFDVKDNDVLKQLCDSLISYIINCRASVDYFKSNIDNIIETLNLLNYSNDEIVKMITKEPSILHEDKENILWKVLLFSKVIDREKNVSIRHTKMIENPRILRISQNVIYARIKYLESDKGKNYLRNDDKLTFRQIIKCTHEEFKNTYGISKEDLLEKYPFDNQAKIEVVSWKDNEELLNGIYKKGKQNNGRLI